MTDTLPLLAARNLARRYGAQTVFEQVNLQVRRGEFVATSGGGRGVRFLRARRSKPGDSTS